jgi:perosamine synthetase
VIPVNEPLLSGNEKKYLNECIDSGWVSSDGPFVKKFENLYSAFIGTKYGVAVSNGTAALEAALYGVGIKKGDEVILPTFTIISCAIACIRLGAKPVFVDCEPETWNMDVSLIEKLITAKTRAIMVVHIYGHPVAMDMILNLKKKYGLYIVEDIAESQGAKYFSEVDKKWHTCGTIGDVSAVSFYGNKVITTGEGGMVLTNSIEIQERVASYRNLCFDQKQRFLHTDIGYNFRMTNLQAAVGVAQIEKIEEHIQLKDKMGQYYHKKLNEISWLRFMHAKEWAKPVYWMYCIEIIKNNKFTAKELGEYLSKNEIGNRPFFIQI